MVLSGDGGERPRRGRTREQRTARVGERESKPRMRQEARRSVLLAYLFVPDGLELFFFCETRWSRVDYSVCMNWHFYCLIRVRLLIRLLLG